MISSPSAQIVNAIAESHLVKTNLGKLAPSYGPTMGIATAIIALGIIVTTAVGPEKRGRKFETVASLVVDVDSTTTKDIEEGIVHDEKKTSQDEVVVSEKV